MKLANVAFALAAAWVLNAPLARAQSAPDTDVNASRADIAPDEFKRMTDGKTVYFELLDGSLWGKEYYLPGTNRTVFEHATADLCLDGYWTREGLRYCYHYRDTPSCWLTFYEGDDIIVEARDGARQRVRKIVSDEPLACGDDVSQAPAAPDMRRRAERLAATAPLPAALASANDAPPDPPNDL